MARGEYHCWLGLPGRDTGRRDRGVRLYGAGQVVDLGLRHLRAMVERMPQVARVLRQDRDAVVLELAPAHDLIRYTREDDFPSHLWVEGEPPAELVYAPDLGAMREFIALNRRRSRLVVELCDRVLEEYARLAGERGLPPP